MNCIHLRPDSALGHLSGMRQTSHQQRTLMVIFIITTQSRLPGGVAAPAGDWQLKT